MSKKTKRPIGRPPGPEHRKPRRNAAAARRRRVRILLRVPGALVAEMINVSQSTLSQWENGYRDPDPFDSADWDRALVRLVREQCRRLEKVLSGMEG